MAREAKAKEQKPIEQTVWDAANKLRGKVEPAENYLPPDFRTGR